jgi:hypothetical protein
MSFVVGARLGIAQDSARRDPPTLGIQRFRHRRDGGQGDGLRGRHQGLDGPSDVIERALFTGYRGRLRWDPSRPNGQPRRRLDVSRAERLFGFQAWTPFEEGLRRTIAWYEAERVPLHANEGR